MDLLPLVQRRTGRVRTPRWIGRLTQLVAVTTSAVLLAAGINGSASASTVSASYYLALGDSLSVGYMPQTGDSNYGYVDDLYTALHAKDASLQLVKLGCSGESTTTMISGGLCTYPGANSQLQAATAFLNAHPGKVKFLTLDIGANDVDDCAPGGSVDVSCALTGLKTLATNTPTILNALRSAAGWNTRFVGMSYYDPFLASWLQGSSGQKTAELSAALLTMLNLAQGAEYTSVGAAIADVAGAFSSLNFLQQTTLPGIGTVPVNVATVCTYTYMCTQQNIHPTVAGYQILARAFAAQLGVTI